MAKINHEEYEVLKELDDKWKWIARDEDRGLYAFTKKPVRRDSSSSYWWNADGWGAEPYSVLELIDEMHLFQFVQWEDEEPYNIAELIEEYEDSKEYKDSLVIEYFMDKANESKETEMKKDIEWMKEEIWKQDIVMNKGYIYTDDLMSIINEVDEPETLSEEWMKDNQLMKIGPEGVVYYVPVENLENLLVPEKELPVIPKFVVEWIEDLKSKKINLLENIYDFTHDEDINNYIREQGNALMRAWLYGYTIRKEHKYHARIKGWQNVTTGSEAFNWVYFKEKDTVGISKAVENKYQAVSFTKYDWNNLGINEDNADFILVEELE